MTHIQRLREIAKFVAGLVAGDLVAGLWFIAAGAPQQNFLGFAISMQEAWLWVGLDVLILAALIHYAWNPKLLEPHASSKSIFFALGIITGAVAIVHFLRLVFGWSVVIAGWPAPMWASWIGVFVAAYLSYTSFHFVAKHGKKV